MTLTTENYDRVVVEAYHGKVTIELFPAGRAPVSVTLTAAEVAKIAIALKFAARL